MLITIAIPCYRSEKNIRFVVEEIKDEYGLVNSPPNGCLVPWEDEGVLLLNSVLTLNAGQSNSHKNIGWEEFTSSVIKYIDNHNTCVFLAWGRNAQSLCEANVSINSVLTAGHPSPLNTTNPFRGCNCFRECNEILMQNKKLPVRWTKIWN